MTSLLDRLSNFLSLDLPAYGMAAALIMLLYAVQAEVRFGARARSFQSGDRDGRSTLLLSVVSGVPIIGFVLVMKSQSSQTIFGLPFTLPEWAIWPLPGHASVAVGWTGVVCAALGLLVRLWAVLTLRERYTRTLLVHEDHRVERKGPYTFVRHPGYVGSLLCLNGLALASGSVVVAVVSTAATFASYVYRIRAEDTMLIASFGREYEEYRREVATLIPFVF